MPRKISTPPLPLSTFGEVARHPTLPRILLVTLVQATAMFTLFAYIAPLVQAALGSVEPVSLVLAALGLAGVVGNAWAVKLLPRWGAPRTVTTAIVSMAIGAALLPLGQGSTWLFCLVAAAMGAGRLRDQLVAAGAAGDDGAAAHTGVGGDEHQRDLSRPGRGRAGGGLLIGYGMVAMVAASVALYLARPRCRAGSVTIGPRHDDDAHQA